jgi:Pyridoxamine 5'-phosphate oxidase
MPKKRFDPSPPSMANWSEVQEEAPELAERAWTLFGLDKHKTLATLRRDGSPRISGTELELVDGDLWLGSMEGAVKALDLRRDPRYALHSLSPEAGWKGDAKIAGRAEETFDPEARAHIVGEGSQAHAFRLDVEELVVVRLGEPADHLLIESWHEGRGLSQMRR